MKKKEPFFRRERPKQRHQVCHACGHTAGPAPSTRCPRKKGLPEGWALQYPVGGWQMRLHWNWVCLGIIKGK